MPNPSELARVEEEAAEDLRGLLYNLDCHPKTHAIIAVMLGREPRTNQSFHGKAIVTSDGFVMCDFIDSNGRYHYGALVCDHAELVENMQGVMAALELTAGDRLIVNQLIRDWVGTDYRR